MGGRITYDQKIPINRCVAAKTDILIGVRRKQFLRGWPGFGLRVIRRVEHVGHCTEFFSIGPAVGIQIFFTVRGDERAQSDFPLGFIGDSVTVGVEVDVVAEAVGIQVKQTGRGDRG